jgi:hypothetical protein
MSPFTREFWVADDPDEVHYEHRPAVVPLPTPHARANAFQAAQLLEQNREDTRTDLRADLMRQRREKQAELATIEAMLDELDYQRALRRKS